MSSKPDAGLVIPAPAKLNLFLHITGRRPDGYHELQTIFQFLDFADELRFQTLPTDEIRITPDLPGIPPETNLIYKAARLLQDETGCAAGAHVHIIKRLPMGGGIGGGSSDAATTLLALNRLWGLDLPLAALANLGLRLGADVPVFIHGRSVWAEGVGERFTPLELPEDWFLILRPDCEISTREIFSHPALTRNSPLIKVAASQAQYGANDCESVVTSLYPAVFAALSWLRSHGNGRLTGTGSCVFMRCDSQEQAEQLLRVAPCSGFVAQGRNESPAHRALRETLKN